MSAEETWSKLIASCYEQPLQLKTKRGLNFNLLSDGTCLIVDQSEIKPSSRITTPRSINKNNFIKVFPYYERWKAGEKGLSSKLTDLTVNSVYIMAAIKSVKG